MAPLGGTKMSIRYYLSAALLLFSGSVAEAEENPITPGLGILPTHSYAISDIEAIDKATGALSLHIPLAQLPPGPAGFTAGLTLVYNSKYWMASHVQDTMWGLEESFSGGWRLVMESTLDTEVYQASELHPVCRSDNNNLRHLLLTNPDGSRNLFYLSYPSMPQMDGCDDKAVYDTSLLNKAIPSVWYTADGSYLRLEVDAAQESPVWPSNASWTVYRQDGTSISQELSGIVRIRDRNGNRITIEKLIDGGNEFERMSDEFGRKIELHHMGDYRDEVRQTAHDGTTLIWGINGSVNVKGTRRDRANGTHPG